MKFVDLNNLRENLENFYLKIISPKISLLNENKLEEGDIARIAFTGSYDDLENKPNVDLTPYAKLKDVYTKEEIDASNTFTTTSATTIEVGGISAGSNFKNASLSEIMLKMLYGTVTVPAPKFVGNAVASIVSNTITIPLESSSGYKTIVVDSSKVSISSGEITSISVSNGNVIVKVNNMESGTLTFGAGALKNTPTTDSVYSGNSFNEAASVEFEVTRSTISKPSFTATYINSTKTINIKVNASFNESYATLSNLQSSSISGVNGVLSGTGKDYTFAIDDSVAPGSYDFVIAANAVTLSAEEGYYYADSKSNDEYVLPINIEAESDDDSYDWIYSFSMINTDNNEFHLEQMDTELAEIGEDEIYNNFDNGVYELYFLGTSAHPCEILVPAADTEQEIGIIPEGNATMIKHNAYWDLDVGSNKQLTLYNFVMLTGTYNFQLKKAK